MVDKMLSAKIVLGLVLIACYRTSTVLLAEHGHKLVSVKIRNAQDLLSLHKLYQETELDFVNAPTEINSYVSIHAPPHEVDNLDSFLAENGLTNVTQTHDIDKLVEEERRSSVQEAFSSIADFRTNKFHNLADINSYLTMVNEKYKSITELFQLKYQTYERRTIRGIKIGPSKTKNIIFLECGIHAREWSSPATCIYIIDKLTTGYSTSTTIKKLVDKYQWDIIPVVNVDGYAYTWSSNRMWRKNRKPSSTYPGCFGTDINRNWNIMWSEHIGSSSNPCSDQYAGRVTESELETKGLKTYLEGIEDRILNYYSIHAFGKLWMFPFAYTVKLSVDYANQLQAAKLSVANIEKQHGTSYRFGPISTTIYQVSGSTIDYIYSILGVKYSFAVELSSDGGGGFVMPATTIVPIASEFFSGLIAALEYTENH